MGGKPQDHRVSNRNHIMLKDKTIIMVDINGQYEFAQIHYLRDDNKYIAFTTRSGRVMGGPFIADDERSGTMKGDGANYALHMATGAESGHESAVEYFNDNA
jgi:hypothetical protein